MLYLKQSTAVDIKIGPFLDETDGKTAETALTLTQPDIRLAKNGGNWAQKNAAQTLSHEENGWYELALDATDTNTLGILMIAVHESGALPVWFECMVVPANVWDSLFGSDFLQTDVTQWLGTNAATPTVAGVPEVDTTHFNGTAGTFSSGRPEVIVNSLNANAITATSINADAITAAKIATGAIDADAIAADAVAKLRSYVSGTADSGTTTTMVDAALTEADTDYWKGSFILFTSGTIAGQCRLITGFTPASDTITFAPATTQAVGTNTYEIIPAARVDVNSWLGSVVNALVSGRVDASAGAIANDAITAAAIANGAIDAATFAAGAIDAAALATGAIDADALAADAVTEIWAKAMTELSSVPGVTGTVLEALSWVFLLARNKITQTATTQLLRNDADSGTIGTSTLSDDGTTFTRGEFA